MGTDSWHSLDGVWVVHRLPGWIRHGQAGSDFYQVKRLGRLVAELDSFEQVAAYVPIERLIADQPQSPTIPDQRTGLSDQAEQADQ